MIIEGALAVKAAILGSKRTVHQVSIDKNKESKDVDFIKRICKEKQISLELVSLDDVMQIATGKTHGGIVAQVSSRKRDRRSI